MTALELQAKLQERYGSLTWKVAENAHPPPGVPDGFEAEWWEVEAMTYVHRRQIVASWTDAKKDLCKPGATIIIAQRIARNIGYEVVNR